MATRIETDTLYDDGHIQTGKRGQITGFFIEDIAYSCLGRIIIHRLIEDRDVKIVITGKGKTTGTGKTTLAILLAKWVNDVRNELIRKGMLTCWYCDREVTEPGIEIPPEDAIEFGIEPNTLCHNYPEGGYEWSAAEYSFMTGSEYIDKYNRADPGTPLVTDELEHIADRRRSPSNVNLEFTQTWSIYRYKNCITIGTAPGKVDLDKRIPEGADIWINVVEKGRANVYYQTFDDFELEPIVKRLKMFGYREVIRWAAIPDDDDYIWLKKQKATLNPGFQGGSSLDESDIKSAKSSQRKMVVKRLIKGKFDGDHEMTQREMGNILGMSQEWVSRMKRKMVENGEIG